MILEAAIVDHLTKKSWTNWLASWTAAATIVAREDSPCPACGKPSDVYIGELGWGEPRRCQTCHFCNTVEDGPLSVYARLEIPHVGHVRLTGWRPSGSWLASLTVSASAPWERLAWRWPAGPDGEPIEEATSLSWPAGPVRVAAILVSERGPTVINRLIWSDGRCSARRQAWPVLSDYPAPEAHAIVPQNSRL